MQEVRLSALAKILEEPARAALWWADSHPDKLAYLRDGSFEALVRSQPELMDYRLGEATDPDSEVIRNFLAAVSDGSNRQAVARLLSMVIDYVPNGAERRPPGVEFPGK